MPPRARAGLGLLLVLLVLVTFGRASGFEFLTWDDTVNVSLNPLLNPPTARHLAQFWSGPFQELYIPVPYTAWWGIARFAHVDFPDEQGSQLNPWLFHAANVAVHAITTLVVFALLRRLLAGKAPHDPTWPAFAAAALFAVHPLQVEPVAWVTGMRDLLAGLFAIVTLWQYTLAASSGRRGYWFGAAAAFVAALLSKPAVVVLPLMAMAIDVWIVGRPWRQAMIPTALGLLLAVPALYVTHRVQASEVPTPGPAVNHLFVAGDALTFYLRQLFLPIHLSADYGRRPAKVLGHAWVYGEWLVPLAILIAAWFARRRRPLLFVAGILFFVPLVPASGIVSFNYQYYSTVADRYAYLAMLGVSLAVAALLARLPRAGILVTMAIVLGLAVRSFAQLSHWQDSQALWQHALDLNPGDFAAETEIGMADVARQQTLNAAGQTAEARAASARAIDHFRRALADYPLHGIARKHLTAQELYLGDWPAALNDARELVHTSRVQPIRNATRWVPLFTLFAAEADRRGDYADADLFRGELLRIQTTPR